MTESDDNIVRLPKEPPPPAPPTPPGRLHGLAIAGMAVSALVGIFAMLAFITVGWPGNSGRVLVGAFVLSGIGFLTCASLAVLTAARDTYARSGTSDE